MNQQIQQPSTFMKQSIEKTQKKSRPSYSPRSGEESTFAQTVDARLGETATVTPGDFASSRLGEAVSPEQDSSSLKTQPLTWASA